MTGIQWHPRDPDAIHFLNHLPVLVITGIEFPSWIIGKTGQNFNFMATLGKLLSKWKAEKKIRFRLKVMCNKQNFHRLLFQFNTAPAVGKSGGAEDQLQYAP